MDVQLKNLIEKLKKEGVEAAQQQSNEIIDNAKNEAKKIVDKAKDESNLIIQQAKQKAIDFKSSAEAALRQASRDMVLVIREKITNLFERTLKGQVQESLSTDFLKELILKSVEQINSNEPVEILVGKSDEAKLQKLLQSGLKNELKNDIELKVDNRISNGFRIGLKGKNVYYDFTDESIVSALKIFLNTSLAKLMEDKKSGKDNG